MVLCRFLHQFVNPYPSKKNESWWNWWNCLPSWHRYISGRTLPSLVTPFNNFSMFIISFKQLLQTLNILFQTKVNWHISQSLIFNSYQSRPCVEISKVFDRYLPQYALAEILPNCTKMKNIIFSNHTVSSNKQSIDHLVIQSIIQNIKIITCIYILMSVKYHALWDSPCENNHLQLTKNETTPLKVATMRF